MQVVLFLFVLLGGENVSVSLLTTAQTPTAPCGVIDGTVKSDNIRHKTLTAYR